MKRLKLSPNLIAGHNLVLLRDGDFPLAMARIQELVGDRLNPPVPRSKDPRTTSFLDRLFGNDPEEAEREEFGRAPRPQWPLYLLATPIIAAVAVARIRTARDRDNDI
jgi:hypothetical protein